VICLSGQLVAREVAHSSLRAIGSRECAPDDRLHQGVNHKQRRSALVRITDLIPTAAAFDSFWDSQIGEVLIRCLLLREEQHRWVERLGSYGLI
jgi:hypothetical protein